MGDRAWSREQKRAIETRGQDVLVSAGAGSGKTSVLVERVVQCLAGPHAVDLQRLLIVTFTEAAAAEMRARIAQRLEALYQDCLAAGDAATARRLAEQLAQVEQAQISTLHSFCLQVVRRNFNFLGLEPVFELMAEDEQLLLRSQVLDHLLETGLQGAARDGLQSAMLRFAQGEPDHWKTLVLRLYEFARSAPEPEGWLDAMAARFSSIGDSLRDTPWSDAFMQSLRRTLERARDDFASAQSAAASCEELQKYADNLQALSGLVQDAIAALDDFDLARAAAVLQAASALPTPRAGQHPVKQHVQDKRKAGLDRIGSVLPVLARGEAALLNDLRDLAPDVANLVAFVKDFARAYASAKRQRARLDFSDLEHLAWRVLSSPESGEARRLQEWYVEIFLDEYQDTSPIQDALVRQIARPAGNTFVVGDVKQSIYRFRLADPRLFLDKYQRLAAGGSGTVIDLTTNYRSRREVVDAVNFVFAQLFSEALGGIAYDERAAMSAGANYAQDDSVCSLAGPVELHLVSRDRPAASGQGMDAEADFNLELDSPDASDSEDAPVRAIEAEAAVIARRILELTGRWDGSPARQVWDTQAQAFRPVQFRDIVILLRSVRSRMNLVLETLRKFGIPAYGATATGFYGALEVQWLLAALAAIDNPRRDIDFTAMLRSPIGRFSDEDLARVRILQRQGSMYDAFAACAAGGARTAWEGVVPATEADALQRRVREFLDRFQQWRSAARQDSTERVLSLVLEETGMYYYLCAMPGGDIRRANVEALLAKIRQFDRNSLDGVHGFVNYAKDALRHELDMGEARTLGENEDVVRVMTIHHSKGLEFPVVFVADLGKEFYRDPLERQFPLHRDLGFGPQFTDPDADQRWPTVASLAVEELERSESLAEEARLLYVAMTRAREKLILVGSCRKLDVVLQRAARASEEPGVELPTNYVLSANSLLEWILPALLRHRTGHALRRRVDQLVGAGAHIHQLYDAETQFSVQLWNVEGAPETPTPPAGSEISLAVSQAGPSYGSIEGITELLARAASAAGREPEDRGAIEFVEPQDGLSVPGKLSATDLRRIWVSVSPRQRGQDAGFAHPGNAERLLEDPPFAAAGPSGRASGTAFHTVLQFLDLSVTPTAAGVAAEIERLVAAGRMTEREAAAVVVEDVVAFLLSELGRRLVRATDVYREQPFFHRLDVPGRTAEPHAGFVVVQGVIDCLARESGRWFLVDYKTDQVAARDAQAKAWEYAAQIATYRAVVEDIVGEQIESYIYFVKPRVVVPMASVELENVFNSPLFTRQSAGR